MGRGTSKPDVVDVDEIQRRAGTEINSQNCKKLLGISWSNWRSVKAEYRKVKKTDGSIESVKKERGATTTETADKIADALARISGSLGCSREDILKSRTPGFASRNLPASSKTADSGLSRSTPAASLTRRPWYIYHHMALTDGQKLFLKATLIINQDGVCTLSYPANEQQPQSVDYAGKFQYEAHTRFIITFQSQSEFKEIRILHVNYALGDRIHGAMWSGTDYADRLACGYALMAEEKFKDGGEEKIFEEYVVKRHPMAAREPSSKAQVAPDQSEAQLYNFWKTPEIANALRVSRHGEVVSIISGCFPDSVLGEIERGVRFLNKNIPAVGTSEKLKINILLLHYNSIAIDNVRQRYYPQRKVSDLRERVFRQAQLLLDLGRDVADKVSLNLALFDGWIFGSYFRFGQTIYYSPVLPGPSAINGFMIRATAEDAMVWERLTECWSRTNEIACDKENGEQLDRNEVPPSQPRQNKKFD